MAKKEIKPVKKEETLYSKNVGRKLRKDKKVAVVMTQAASEVADVTRKSGRIDQSHCIHKIYEE